MIKENKKTTENNFSEEIKKWLKESKEPDYKSAQKLGVSPSTLNKWKNGRGMPRGDTLMMLIEKGIVSISLESPKKRRRAK